MPPIFMHMAVARDIREQMAQDLLDAEPGAFYLGATTPDIRVLTRGDRRDTHFFDLDNPEHQDSVAEFFRLHSRLSRSDEFDPQTRAFICGYVTHLVLDESYIVSMYRPYFGQLSALGGDMNANMMDRLLQYELNRRRLETPGHVDEIRGALEQCSLAVDVGFLDSETLKRWQQVAIDITRHPPNWDRFRNQGGRHLSQAWMEDPAAYEEFLKTVPELLQRTIQHVSTAQVDAFIDRSREQAIAVVERYLECE
jgi:Zinc dependent phospholipase C